MKCENCRHSRVETIFQSQFLCFQFKIQFCILQRARTRSLFLPRSGTVHAESEFLIIQNCLMRFSYDWLLDMMSTRSIWFIYSQFRQWMAAIRRHSSRAHTYAQPTNKSSAIFFRAHIRSRAHNSSVCTIAALFRSFFFFFFSAQYFSNLFAFSGFLRLFFLFASLISNFSQMTHSQWLNFFSRGERAWDKPKKQN